MQKNFKRKFSKKNLQIIFVNNPRPTAVPISHSCVHTNSNVVYTLSTDAFLPVPGTCYIYCTTQGWIDFICCFSTANQVFHRVSLTALDVF